MTSYLSLWLMLLVTLCGGCVTASRTTVVASDGSTVSVGVFYDALAPYGEWIYVGNYGRVWRPSVAVVGVGFRPYGPGGHWVNSEYGWSFESDWSWGWAPFHYGRWYLDPAYGWVWIPGSVWAPAWVTWRYGGGYVGWAPLPPPGAAIVVETYHPYWCFVETRYLVVHDVYHYAMPVQNYHVAFSATVTVQQTQGVGGARWNAGPPAGQVSRDIGQPIHTASVTPPPPGSVQAHRISPAHPVAAGSSVAPASGTTAGAHSPPSPHGPAPAQPVEHSSRAPERVDAEGHAVDRQPPRPEHEGDEREGHERSEAAPGHVAAPSHSQPPAPPPPGKRKRR